MDVSAISLGVLSLVSIGEAQDNGSRRPLNYRAQVVVTDRVNDKVVASDSFNSVFIEYGKLSRSRGTGPDNAESSAFEIIVRDQVKGPSTDAVYLEATAQLHLLKRVAGDDDTGGDIAQNVAAYVNLGTPYTMVDMVTDRAGRRKVTVQITITRVPVE